MICTSAKLSTRTDATEFVGRLIDRWTNAAEEFVAVGWLNADGFLNAACDVDLTGGDFPDDALSLHHFYLCHMAAAGRQPTFQHFDRISRPIFVEPRTLFIEDRWSTLDLLCDDRLFGTLPTLAEMVKQFSQQAQEAQRHFKALDDLGARLADRRLIDATHTPQPHIFSSPRHRRKAGRYA